MSTLNFEKFFPIKSIIALKLQKEEKGYQDKFLRSSSKDLKLTEMNINIKYKSCIYIKYKTRSKKGTNSMFKTKTYPLNIVQ